jgi:serine/threonine-protein kinase
MAPPRRPARGLSPRDSLLLLADSLRASVSRPGPPDVAETSRTRRQFTLLEGITARYPDDAEMWYDLGDAYFHGGFGPTSISDEKMLATFEKAIALDSAFAPAYPHLVEIAFRLFRDTTRALRYSDRYVALSSPAAASTKAFGSWPLSPRAALDSSSGEKQGTERASRCAVRRLRTSPVSRSGGDGLRAARAILSAASEDGAEALTAGMHVQAAEALAWRGHSSEAYRALGSRDNSLAADAFALGCSLAAARPT